MMMYDYDSESALLELVGEGEEVGQVDVADEEGVCVFEELGDGFVLAAVAEGAEVLFLLLFEDEHLICEGAGCKHPVNEHEILTDVELEGICLHTTLPT